jgi:tRNA-splicing ligase RtcB (3'-phosphate/5'-hydroxy nucleic acid ligase)
MKQVVETPGIPIKLWLDDLEQSAMDQTGNLARLPFAFHHIAIMPDGHTGIGMPIGGVLATKDVIIPACVGVDIGCGVLAFKTILNRSEVSVEQVKKVMDRIRKTIPVGFAHHTVPKPELCMPPLGELKEDSIVKQQYESARTQIGTLGGGNQFIELQYDSDNNIWVMIHSGSRNLGFIVANHYNKKAIELNAKWFSSVPAEWNLAFLPWYDQVCADYLREMEYCCEFARCNRRLMADEINVILHDIFHCDFHAPYDVSHNYVAQENHFGHNVWVHRKGAIRARKDEVGIIPGSQGTASYGIRGKGNPDSFMSCSHGAGRTMSRTKAKATLNLQDEIKRLDDLGVIHSVRNSSDLDEAAGSYKDIDMVMSNQSDLIEPVTKLMPLAVIKG